MTKITRIKKLNSFGLFESFDWPTGGELELFDKNNLVYGFNGSGKTNLSRIFGILETQKPRTDVGYDHATFTLETDVAGTRITESRLESAPCVRVFNKDFIKAHIQIEQGLTNSFFHLIKLDPEDRKKLTALYAEKQKLTDGRTLKREEKEAVAEEKSKILATTRSIIKETLSGTGPYFTNYDVTKLEQRVNEVNSGEVTAKVLTPAKLKSEKTTKNIAIANRRTH